jgi:hypothetical protein
VCACAVALQLMEPQASRIEVEAADFEQRADAGFGLGQ